MFSFIDFLSEEFDVQQDPNSKNVRYTTAIGDKHIHTHFVHRKGERYEIAVERRDPPSEEFPEGKPTEHFDGREKMSMMERHRSGMAVLSHVRHFIDQNKNKELPLELVAGGNTDRKKEAYKHIFRHLKTKLPDVNYHEADRYARLRFDPTPEQMTNVARVKETNKQKMKSIYNQIKDKTNRTQETPITT